MTAGWIFAAGLTHLMAACAAATLAAWLSVRRSVAGAAGTALVVALGLSAVWAMAVAATSVDGHGAHLWEAARNLAWLLVVYRLFSADGRHTLVRPIRPVMYSLAAIELFQILLGLLAPGYALGAGGAAVLFHMAIMFRLMFTIGGLVLLHNLYGGASASTRAVLHWPSIAVAGLWLFDLNLYTVAYLGGGWPDELAALRGLALLATVAALIPGLAKRRAELRFSPSRAVAFELVSLLGIGIYLLGMTALGKWLSYVGGDYARVFRFGFLIAGMAAAALVLPSRRLRGWLKVTLVKHLFRHRYDYRAEWLRFNRTIGRAGAGSGTLEQRAIQSLCDITDSPAGLLLGPNDHGELALSAQWQWRTADVPAPALGAEACAFFERHGHIVDLDQVRQGIDCQGEVRIVPAWLLCEPSAWALVPLLHFDRLVGVVVLARPKAARMLDWEDFDLLRVVGQQLASYLAEHAGQDALAEAARFDEFNRRIAFVMHDIKNLASQFSLLARNAELHAENPQFRADMLVTLRNSAEKLNALIVRLSRYGKGSGDAAVAFDPSALARGVAEQFAGRHRVLVHPGPAISMIGHAEALEQALVHLVQNGVDASADQAPVFIGVDRDAWGVRIEVVDAGTGMSPDFVRTKLFKPFVSSKNGGFGIGACEARELVRAMGGRLDVESREGIGSRFIIRLPLQPGDAGGSEPAAQIQQKVA
ncbi:XrtA/PEP-CTERM system histidine kinase PrsK [Novosphingobium piscinae]|uniref:histidine kinase n=1 Tax=Novosphingobium piscinae TaxID=1507448 RepID=A0A7X1FX15_9SPHN|nr:XrtA/PEP-CTERM system histidine kinase PrsK [Novosphingobium piscinae]MBC2668554.1 PEP-CTERM system histidine kinase PrsK [Novosphingobium piscinae]